MGIYSINTLKNTVKIQILIVKVTSVPNGRPLISELPIANLYSNKHKSTQQTQT